jgi:hypothetical protein
VADTVINFNAPSASKNGQNNGEPITPRFFKGASRLFALCLVGKLQPFSFIFESLCLVARRETARLNCVAAHVTPSVQRYFQVSLIGLTSRWALG